MATGPRTTVIERFVTEYLFKTDKSALDGIEGRVDGLRKKLDSLGTRFIIAGTTGQLALGWVAKGAITTDEALRRLQARTSSNTQELAAFKQQAYEVGSELPLNTADIIRAQTAFVQLGASRREALAATPSIARAAVAAENVTVQEVARFARFMLNTFDLAADKTGLILDQMLKVETRTAGTFRGIGNAIQYSAESAARAKLSTQEYIATLGVVAGSGREVESVSQGLQLLLTNISKAITGVGRGGPMVQKAFAALNISTEEVKKLMSQPNGWVQLLKLIRDRAPSQEHLTAALSQVGGTTYASAIGFLVRNVDKLESVIGEVGTAQGEVNRQTGIMLSGISGNYKEMVALIDTFRNRLADVAVAGPYAAILRAFTRVLTELTRVDEQGELVHKQLLQIIGGVLFAASSLLFLGLALKAVAFAMGGMLLVGKAIVFLTRSWAAAQWLLNIALAANPVGLLVAGITAAVAAIAALIAIIKRFNILSLVGRFFGFGGDQAGAAPSTLLTPPRIAPTSATAGSAVASALGSKTTYNDIRVEQTVNAPGASAEEIARAGTEPLRTAVRDLMADSDDTELG